MSQTRWSLAVAFCLLCSVGTPAREPLSFEERVKAQEAIERVYYAHRIWPKENPQPKPPFEQMVPKAQIEAKVTDTLKKCTALDTFWQRLITVEQLQAEMDRMAKGTKDPATLKELFSALQDDPTLVAECLARPLLSNRLIQEAYESDASLAKESFGLWWEEVPPALRRADPSSGEASYELPDTNGTRQPEVDGDTWTATSTGTGCPVGRCYHKAVWTGAEMIAWGGGTDSSPGYMNTGGVYDLATDSWTATSTGTDCPAARRGHTAVWTGTEMVIWGGYDSKVFSTGFNTGGRYNPVTDSWIATSTGTNCPLARKNHAAVWMGTEMIVWGGYNATSLRTGGRYSPATDTWTPTSTGTNCPGVLSSPVAVWSGSEMIVWGVSNTGGRYNPSTDSWRAMAYSSLLVSYGETVVWTGTEMIIWGGYYTNNSTYRNDGARYNPSTNTWTATSKGTGCPSARDRHTAVWTGTEMIIWAGLPSSPTGARYNPSTNTWTAMSGANEPEARQYPAAVWTGSQMITWSGFGSSYTNTGGVYSPSTCAAPWTPFITSIIDDDACLPTGITVAYTPGSGAERHDLYKDGFLAATGYNSGAFYVPGDPANHMYFVQAVSGSCTANSPGVQGRDQGTPATPVITAVNDVDWCAQSGIEVVYTAGAGATSHDLYKDGSLAASNYASNTNYLPGDMATHTYVVRAINTCTYADSSGMAGTDGNYLPGAPVITAANDLDPCVQSGIAVAYTPGSNALRHDLLRNGTLVVTGYTSGATYLPGTTSSYTYIVQAVYGSCSKNSTGLAVADGVGTCVPPAEAAPGSSPSNAQTWTDKTTQCWPLVSGATGYTLYRGAQADLPNLLDSNADSCTKYAGAALSATIADDPSSVGGLFYWYLVTASNASGEGPAGNATAGARVVNSPGVCP